MTLTRFLVRNLIAATGISVAAAFLVYGFLGVTHVLAPVILISLALTSGTALLFIRGAKSDAERLFIRVCAAYVCGMLLVAIGGLGWQVAEYGLARTNVEGYLTWIPIYGLLFLPITLTAMSWITNDALVRRHRT